MEEITIVNEKNEVVGSAPRIEVHRRGLWHRVVVIMVTNSAGELFIQKRNADADTCPNMWDHSAAGHVDKDEEPDIAAKRELFEELGIQGKPLKFITIYKTESQEGEKFLRRFWYLYICKFDGEMKLQKEEVQDGKFVTIEWLQKELQFDPEIYTTGLRKSLEEYLQRQSIDDSVSSPE
ncbi:NUDIX domain-containing protein [Candidatus Roizmanbacteria bacterium]|nr:NUDIX domain-containing protein [Candidatus Roizmanbacteria bacterium]